jgi:hypothetical protein
MLNHPCRDLRARLEPQLREDVLNVGLRGPFGDEQPGRDGLVGQALGASSAITASAPSSIGLLRSRLREGQARARVDAALP